MGTDIRADLVPCVDAARQCVEDLGLRRHLVEIRTVTWSGGELGLGNATEASLVVVTPRPLVAPPEPRLVAARPGKYAQGDRVISKISRTYTEADFPDSVAADSERYFQIDGDPYRMVGEPEIKNFEWRIQVRRMRKRPPVVAALRGFDDGFNTGFG